MKTNINVNVTRIHNIKRTDGTSITFIEVVVTNNDINKTYTIYVHPKYMESGRLLKELKNCIHSCCTNYLPLIDWDSTTGIVEDAVGKFQDAVQDCINKGEIKTYNTLGKNHKAAEHYRYFPQWDEINARIAAFKGEKVEIEDQPQANTETNKNNNTMNNNREKMMGGAVTTKTGLTINVWGLKNNMYQVKVSWRNRKASFEVEAPEKVADAIYANTAVYARVSLAQYMADHLEDIRMPFLLSPNVKKAHKDQWNKNKEEWVAYGKAIAMGWATLDIPHWYCYNKRTNDQTPVVVEEPQAVEEPQVVEEPQAVVEDTPMVEEQVVDVAEEDDMKYFIATIESQVGKNIRNTLKYDPIAVKVMTMEIYRAYSSSIWFTNNTQYLLTLLFAYCGLESCGLTCTNKLIDDICNAWEVEGLPMKKNIVRRISNLFDGGGVDNIDEDTIQELRDIAAGADETFEIMGVNIINLYTAISLAQVNEKWESQVRNLLHGNTQEPTSEISKVPQEVEQVVEEPKVDDEEDKHWDIRIETTHNESDGYTCYLARVKRWDYINHSINKNCGALQVTFDYYPCLKDNPKENKRVKDLIKSICVDNRHLLKRDYKYCYLFDYESSTLFRNKVEERWQAETKQYENVA